MCAFDPYGLNIGKFLEQLLSGLDMVLFPKLLVKLLALFSLILTASAINIMSLKNINGIGGARD